MQMQWCSRNTLEQLPHMVSAHWQAPLDAKGLATTTAVCGIGVVELKTSTDECIRVIKPEPKKVQQALRSSEAQQQ